MRVVFDLCWMTRISPRRHHVATMAAESTRHAFAMARTCLLASGQISLPLFCTLSIPHKPSSPPPRRTHPPTHSPQPSSIPPTSLPSNSLASFVAAANIPPHPLPARPMPHSRRANLPWTVSSKERRHFNQASLVHGTSSRQHIHLAFITLSFASTPTCSPDP
jgi:hypothetical protein